MKEIINLPSKYNYIIAVVFLSIVFFGIIYFVRNYVKYQDALRNLVETNLAGRIIKYEERGRGMVKLQVKNNATKSTLVLPLLNDYILNENVVTVGDSIYKETNSKIIRIYKSHHGETTFFDYEIEI